MVKICKKHDKTSNIAIKEHYIDVLRRCEFYNARDFGALIADTQVCVCEREREREEERRREREREREKERERVRSEF